MRSINKTITLIILSFYITAHYGDSSAVPIKQSNIPNGLYTIEINDGRIDSLRQLEPDVLDPASSSSPPLEEIALTFNTINWTFEPSGVMHTDAGKAEYGKQEPDTHSFTKKISLTWAIIAGCLIILSFLMNALFLSYYCCCSRSKTTKLEIKSDGLI